MDLKFVINEVLDVDDKKNVSHFPQTIYSKRHFTYPLKEFQVEGGLYLTWVDERIIINNSNSGVREQLSNWTAMI